MSHVTYPENGVFSSKELAGLTGFNRRHIPRKAAKGEIPDARRTKSGCRWEFPTTHNLRAWICFYRVRRSLLRRVRSYEDEKVLRAWGTDWKTALATYEALTMPSWRLSIACGELGTFQLGPECTWEGVEAIVLKIGLVFDRARLAEFCEWNARQ